MSKSDMLMDEVYPLFRQLERLRWKNSETHELRSIEFDFVQGSIKFTYNNKKEE